MLWSTELDRENQSTVCNQNEGKFLIVVSCFVSVLLFSSKDITVSIESQNWRESCFESRHYSYNAKECFPVFRGKTKAGRSCSEIAGWTGSPSLLPWKNMEPVTCKISMITCILKLEESTDGLKWENGVLMLIKE